jgi:gamma-glutamylcyclotransferase (GGCT)/AIG2-like uncharacterized protein YtfP
MECNTSQDGQFHVFVYGTLKPGGRAYRRFCEPSVLAMATARAPGRLYELSMGYPAMTLEAGWVQGMRLTFDDPEALKAMDEFEDYYPNHPEDSEYQRICHTVYVGDSSNPFVAWVYTMEPQQIETLQGQWLPEGLWNEPAK